MIKFIFLFSSFLENPVLCDENLPKLVGMFEMYYARLMGVAHCIIPQLLPIANDPQSSTLMQPPMDLLASIMKPNQQITLGGNQMPSIVQIIVSAQSLNHVSPLINNTEDILPATIKVLEETTTSSTTILDPEPLLEFTNETSSTPNSIEYSSTEESLRSSLITSQPQSTTTHFFEPERDEEIDDIQLNEDIDTDDYHENEEKIKKSQRDRSDMNNYKYVESFESEKSVIHQFELDPSDNDTELKNTISENYQEPSVLPVPKALSSSKSSEELTEHEKEAPE